MAGNPVLINQFQNYDFNGLNWPTETFTTIRKNLLSLALSDDSASSILKNSIEMIRSLLHCNVIFIEGSVSQSEQNQLACFFAHSNKEIIGTLLIDKSAFEYNMSDGKQSLQEITDILALTLVATRQSEELESLELESEEMLKFAPDIIFVVSNDGSIKLANQKALDLVHFDESKVMGSKLTDILGSQTPDFETIFKMGEKEQKLEIEIQGKWERRLASFNISPVKQNDDIVQVLMVGRDITTERQAELALRRSERSTMMSQTIDYLLHEVNNPLAALLSNITLASKNTTKLSNSGELVSKTDESLTRISKSLAGAKKAGTRIRNAMDTLRDANRKRTLSGPVTCDVSYELGLAISSVEPEYKNLKITKDVSKLPSIDAPPLHLAEIFGSVIKNAAEAKRAGDDSLLKVNIASSIQANELVIIVDDNGVGVPEDISEQIFMPFFTTKPLGNSIGLGLSMAKDMIKRVGGSINVTDSKNLCGASFVLTFPIK